MDTDRNRKIGNRNFGFTLIEVVVGIFGFVVIALGLIALVSNVLVSSSKQSNLLSDADQARRQAFGIINQLRNAQTSSVGGYPLEMAGNQVVVFYSNMDKDSAIERVRYYVQEGKLYQGITEPVGNPLTYDPANEESMVVVNNLANGTDPVFYYYDGSYDGITDNYLTQPISVTAVKFVKMDLKIFNKAGMVNTNFYTVTASGSVRNLKDNLGQVTWLPGTEFQLTTQVSPGGTGNVAASPPGPDYQAGSLVNINALPNIGYAFFSWSGDVADQGSQATTIVMDGNQTVTANFTSLPQTLTGSISGKSGTQMSNRRWRLLIENTTGHFINDATLYSFNLIHTGGVFCTPAIISPAAFPAVMGDISSHDDRTFDVRINFSGCDSSSRFTVDFVFAGNNGADWGSTHLINQAP